FSGLLNLLLIVAASERKALTVVFHNKIPVRCTRCQTYERVTGTAMLSDVDQTLLNNSQNFTADALRHFQVINVCDEARIDSGLALKPFDSISKHAEQALGIDIDSLHLLHKFAQLEDFFPE